MAFTFTLNYVPVEVEVAPKIVETLDDTLDSATCILKANTDAEPVKPDTPFEVSVTGGDVFRFLVASDNVEVYSKEPLLYKHTLSLIQDTRAFSKQLVRNSVFSQPAQKVKKGYWSIGQFYVKTYGFSPNQAGNLYPMPKSCQQGRSEIPLSLSDKEKIKGVPYVVVDYQCFLYHRNSHTSTTWYCEEVVKNVDMATLTSKIDTGWTRTGNLVFGANPNESILFYIYYKDSNNTDQVATVQASDIVGGVVEFGKPLYIPKIKTILENGGKELCVSGKKFHYYVNVQPGTTYREEWDSYDSMFWEDRDGNEVYEQIRIRDSESSASSNDVPDEHYPCLFATQINLCIETYYHTVYDILDLLKARQLQTIRGTSRNIFTYNLNPSSETGQLLQKTIAPNFIFTQCSMYECLAEVFRLYDATFKLGSSQELIIEYLNSSDNISELTNADFSNETRTISDDRYNSGLISYYQDARITEFFPSKFEFVKATSEALGVPAEGDHCFLLPHNIDNIVSAKGKVLNFNWTSNTNDEFYCSKKVDVDVSSFIVEQSIWAVLDSTATFPKDDDFKQVIQKNSVFYTKGSNKIDIAYSFQDGWLGQTNWAFGNMLKSALCKMFSYDNESASSGTDYKITLTSPDTQEYMDCYIQVEYETSVDGRVKNESIEKKFNGEMLIDQYNGAVDLNKMGLNMMGLSLRLGEPTLNATHKITSFNDRIRKGTIYIDESGKKWVANVCSYTILDQTHILGEISFTANYNALSLRTKLNRERRMTNISSDLISKSEDNHVSYVYFSSETDINSLTEQTTVFTSWSNDVVSSFFPISESSLHKDLIPQVAILNSQESQDLPGVYAGFYIPMVKYVSGNSLCFEMSYNSPNVVGNITQIDSGWYGNNKQFTTAVKYTDDLGFLDYTKLQIINNGDQTTTNISDNYPVVIRTVNTALIDFGTYYLYKQPNEIFALNYQLCFLPVPAEKDKLFLGRAFYDNNFLVNDNVGTHQFFIHYGYGRYDILDTEIIDGNDSANEILQVSTIDINNYSGNGRKVTFNHSASVPTNATCWCLADEDGNIYIMSNTVNKSSNSQSIQFTTRRTRL